MFRCDAALSKPADHYNCIIIMICNYVCIFVCACMGACACVHMCACVRVHVYKCVYVTSDIITYQFLLLVPK